MYENPEVGRKILRSAFLSPSKSNRVLPGGLGPGVAVGVGNGVGIGVGVTIGVGIGVIMGVGKGVGIGVDIGVGVVIGVGMGVGIGVGIGVGTGVGVGVPLTLARQLPLAETNDAMAVFETSQNPVTAPEIDGFIIEFAHDPELSTWSAPRL